MHNESSVRLIGNIGQDPVLKTVGDNPVANFTVATTQRWVKDGKPQEKTEWHNVTAWRGLAESCKHLRKGSYVLVEGQLRSRTYVKDDVEHKVWEIDAWTIGFLDRKPSGAQKPDDLGDAPPVDDIPY